MGRAVNTGAPVRSSRVAWRQVGVFVGLTYALTWALEVGVWFGVPAARSAGGLLLLLSVAMWVPALVTLGVCRATGGDWARRVGLRSPTRWTVVLGYAVAGFAAVAAAFVVAFFIAVATGIVQVDLGLPLLRAQATAAGMPSTALLLAITGVSALIAPFTLNGALALGEEIGWRGFLLPLLLPLGRGKAVSLSGVVWGVWHAPLIAMGYEYGTQTFLPAGICLFTLFCMCSGAVLSWLRLRSDSVLPCAVGHGAINALAGLPVLFYAAGATPHPFLGPSVGITAVAGFAVVAAVLLWRARRTDR